MKKYNPLYNDIIIDNDALQSLPENGSVFNDLRSYSDDDDDVENVPDVENTEGGEENGPEQGGATGAHQDDTNYGIVEAYASINPLHQHETTETNIVKALNHALGTDSNPVPFPEQTNRVNDYNYPSLQALAFPTLFPFGVGDVAKRDRISHVSLTNSNTHLMKYCKYDEIKHEYVYPFATHDRWMHWAQNTAERLRGIESMDKEMFI